MPRGYLKSQRVSVTWAV